MDHITLLRFRKNFAIGNEHFPSNFLAFEFQKSFRLPCCALLLELLSKLTYVTCEQKRVTNANVKITLGFVSTALLGSLVEIT